MDKQSFDITAARKFQQMKREKRMLCLENRYKDACADFQNIVNMIIKKYNPRRIYPWGSLLNAEHFTKISDIDIAIEGLDGAESFFKLVAEAIEMTSFPLDIVELEHIHELQKNMILKTGRLVYERD